MKKGSAVHGGWGAGPGNKGVRGSLGLGIRKTACIGLNCVLQKRYAQVLSHSTSEYDLFGNRVFMEAIKLR